MLLCIQKCDRRWYNHLILSEKTHYIHSIKTESSSINLDDSEKRQLQTIEIHIIYWSLPLTSQNSFTKWNNFHKIWFTIMKKALNARKHDTISSDCLEFEIYLEWNTTWFRPCISPKFRPYAQPMHRVWVMLISR